MRAESFAPVLRPQGPKVWRAPDRETQLDAREAALEAREAALHQEIAHIARVNLMGEMASGLAHELNQPLAAAVNFLGAAGMLVRNGADRALIQETLEQASDHSLRAGDIIRRLRDFMARRDNDVRVEPVEPAVRDAAALANAGQDHFGVKISFIFDVEARLMLADCVQVQQVLVNLLRNSAEALQAVPSSRRSIAVSTGIVDAETLEIVVRDTGPGIPEHMLAAAGTPFRSTKGAAGMGIGLSICRRIVEAHGGALIVGNHPDGGACIRFTLPMVSAGEFQEA